MDQPGTTGEIPPQRIERLEPGVWPVAGWVTRVHVNTGTGTATTDPVPAETSFMNNATAG